MGIPTMINMVKDTLDHRYYFRYHHSAGDSMTMMNADDLDSNVLGIACVFYILADLEESIPLPDIKMDKVE
jgi:carboxypeptidase Q